MELLLILVGILAILLGLYGVVMPVMPGLLLIWLGTTGTLLLHRADVVAWTVVSVLTVLFLVGTAATIWLPTRTGLRGGAGRQSFLTAAVGGVLGFFLLPVLGFVIGAVAGLLVGERRRLGEWAPARASTGRVLRSYGIGVVIELTLGLTMAVIWAATVLIRG